MQKSRPKDTENVPQMPKEVDYARGEGYLESESSSEEESSDNEEPKNEYQGFDKWGELDHDAETIRSGDETRRLAVCNLDWDRVSAADIYLALSSFCSDSGNSQQSGIKSVKIYISDFGRKRLEEEDKLGPEELRKRRKSDSQNGSASSSEDSGSEGSDLELGDNNYEEKEKSARERVRKYQVNRLRITTQLLSSLTSLRQILFTRLVTALNMNYPVPGLIYDSFLMTQRLMNNLAIHV